MTRPRLPCHARLGTQSGKPIDLDHAYADRGGDAGARANRGNSTHPLGDGPWTCDRCTGHAMAVDPRGLARSARHSWDDWPAETRVNRSVLPAPLSPLACR